MTHNDIIQKLWNLCDVLRDDGINYSDYVTELVLLLFVKMEYENTRAGLLAAADDANAGVDDKLQTSRWRQFSREWIRDTKGDSLDITGLKDAESLEAETCPNPRCSPPKP